MLKLEHISSVKQNIRTIGLGDLVTGMPGKPGKGKNALKIGELDTWAYLAYEHGYDILKELFMVNGDNQSAKTNIIQKIYQTGSADVNLNELASLTSGASTKLKVFTTVAGINV